MKRSNIAFAIAFAGLAVIIGCGVLEGCSDTYLISQAAERKADIAIRENIFGKVIADTPGLEDCKYYGIHGANYQYIQVVRCPHSDTTTISEHGKGAASVVAVTSK